MMKPYPQRNLTADKSIHNYRNEFRKTSLVYLQIDGEFNLQLFIWSRKSLVSLVDHVDEDGNLTEGE